MSPARHSICEYKGKCSAGPRTFASRGHEWPHESHTAHNAYASRARTSNTLSPGYAQALLLRSLCIASLNNCTIKHFQKGTRPSRVRDFRGELAGPPGESFLQILTAILFVTRPGPPPGPPRPRPCLRITIIRQMTINKTNEDAAT